MTVDATTQLHSLTASTELNWPEYAIEAVLLGSFMMSASVMTALLEHPASPVHAAIPDPFTRRALIASQWG